MCEFGSSSSTNPHLFRNPFKVNSEILKAAKASLKVIVSNIAVDAPSGPEAPITIVISTANVADNANEHSYALAGPSCPAMEVSVVESECLSLQGNTSSGGSKFSQAKKPKLSAAVTQVDTLLSSSPDLHHKLPQRSDHQNSAGNSEISEDNQMS